MAAAGNAAVVTFNSCRHTTSGLASASQSTRLESRRLTLLMLKVAIFTRLFLPLSLNCGAHAVLFGHAAADPFATSAEDDT